MKRSLIYQLVDPKSGSPRYVGKTNNLKQRLKLHLLAPTNEEMELWIANLEEMGVVPKIELLETVSPPTPWQHRERFWIAKKISEGADLLNKTNGGGGDIVESEISKQRKQFYAEKQKWFSEIRHSLKNFLGEETKPSKQEINIGIDVARAVANSLSKRVPFRFRWLFYMENEKLFCEHLRKAFKVAIWSYEI